MKAMSQWNLLQRMMAQIFRVFHKFILNMDRCRLSMKSKLTQINSHRRVALWLISKNMSSNHIKLLDLRRLLILTQATLRTSWRLKNASTPSATQQSLIVLNSCSQANCILIRIIRVRTINQSSLKWIAIASCQLDTPSFKNKMINCYVTWMKLLTLKFKHSTKWFKKKEDFKVPLTKKSCCWKI
jgi:hypothetical protein